MLSEVPLEVIALGVLAVLLPLAVILVRGPLARRQHQQRLRQRVQAHLKGVLNKASTLDLSTLRPDAVEAALAVLASDGPQLQFTHVTLDIPHGGISLEPLLNVTSLKSISFTGAPLPVRDLEVLKQLDGVSIDWRGSSAVIDDNNNDRTFCKALDLYLACLSSQWTRALVPPKCAVPVGKVVKVFPKINVAVIFLHRPLRVGDMIVCRRKFKKFSTDDTKQFGHQSTFAGHEWISAKTVVELLRTDDHRDLDVAQPTDPVAESNIDCQFAVRLEELGQRGDEVLWIGHDRVGDTQSQ